MPDLPPLAAFIMANDYAHVEVFQLWGTPFIFFPATDGGRLIPANHIKSIVPDFKGSGSMIFLSNTEKAIRVVQTPEEITHDIIKQN